MNRLLVRTTARRVALGLLVAAALVHGMLGPNPLPLPTAPDGARMHVLGAMLAAAGLVAGTTMETPLDTWRATGAPWKITSLLVVPQLALVCGVAAMLTLGGTAPVLVPWAAVCGVALLATGCAGPAAGFAASVGVTVMAIAWGGPDLGLHPVGHALWPTQWFEAQPSAATVVAACVLLGSGVLVRIARPG